MMRRENADEMYKIYHFDEQIIIKYEYVTVNYIKTENNFIRQYLPNVIGQKHRYN